MRDTFDRTYQTIQNMGIDWQAWIAVCVLSVLLFFVLWLLLRKLRNWYWKVDVQVETLRSIDEHLQTLGQTVKERTLIGREATEKQPEAVGMGELMEHAEAAEQKVTSEQREIAVRKFMELDQGISKSGKIYTEAELEMLIKD